VKIWLLALILAVPALADDQTPREADPPGSIDGWQAAAPGDPAAPEANWVDSSHQYANEQAQALTEWMDAYFGEPNYELEAPESLIRIDFTTDWDEEDGTNNNIRLRGKLQLPAISKRLNLVFNDESGDDIDIDNENGPKVDDGFGLLYELTETMRGRFDLTLGLNWNKLRPGVRYRFQDKLGDVSSYRFTQRLQWDNKDGGYATTQVLLNRALGENTILRWNNVGVYGEETDGTEWVTRLSLFQRHKTVNKRHELGISYFGAINGVTDPEYVKNYRLGVLFRHQVYRKFLFFEVEPAYNYRQRHPDEKRQFAWSIALRFQIALERDLDKKKKKKNGNDNAARAAESATDRPLRAPEEKGDQYQPAPDPDLPGEDL